MKLCLGLLEDSFPHETRIFTELEGKLVDLKIAHACYLRQTDNEANVSDRAIHYFPETIADFLHRGEAAQKVLDQTLSFAQKGGVTALRGPAGEKVAYDVGEIRVLPPFQNPEKSFVIGFSDKARVEAMPAAEIPTAFYKLPQTFVTDGAPIIWPKFSDELDADACLAFVIGKSGKRIPPENAWEYVAGVTLLIDFTARDVNRREGLTTNNLLGKNFPSSTSMGPSVLVKATKSAVEALDVELSVDGDVKQHFTLRDCVFSVEQIIARWSLLGIKPGDFLAIGASMALQGDRLQNPVPLKIGSTVRCRANTIGELSHRVVSPRGVLR